MRGVTSPKISRNPGQLVTSRNILGCHTINHKSILAFHFYFYTCMNRHWKDGGGYLRIMEEGGGLLSITGEGGGDA